MPQDANHIYYKKKALLVTLRRIEKRTAQQNYFVRNLRKTVGLGVLLSLSIPGQGLGTNAFKGPSILVVMDVSYWELASAIAFFYTIGCFIGHYIWKWQDALYLKELYADRERLMRELGLWTTGQTT